MKQREVLLHATHVNGWSPAVYMNYMSQNFRLFHFEFIRPKLSFFSAHVSVVSVIPFCSRVTPRPAQPGRRPRVFASCDRPVTLQSPRRGAGERRAAAAKTFLRRCWTAPRDSSGPRRTALWPVMERAPNQSIMTVGNRC